MSSAGCDPSGPRRRMRQACGSGQRLRYSVGLAVVCLLVAGGGPSAADDASSAPRLGVSKAWPMWSAGPLAVNEGNGNLVLAVPAPSYPTGAGSLGIGLTYNSLGGLSNGGLGAGWTLSAGGAVRLV